MCTVRSRIHNNAIEVSLPPLIQNSLENFIRDHLDQLLLDLPRQVGCQPGSPPGSARQSSNYDSSSTEPKKFPLFASPIRSSEPRNARLRVAKKRVIAKRPISRWITSSTTESIRGCFSSSFKKLFQSK
ncbi:hypothetical protein Pmar_PMAR021057 [Perkinsus marinus ATCC 50983]|uniref:Uncharacterized protein n=1 Tax=Perkinsus marinus (strain ATCC 50983 / TXsc) TaxID=423536 RepID=C5KGA3_PERM5|nr:hypothetical protein Pmar_PMAR021057 [Perkinsus marinus ATCC 50983]EER16459.1 hypothetical protein Pmar_PMAR021057 [Perkinsus marinus ATCC 50983]|eukprot:XP_002784663.1 hypothetical protein Pmar_PMAR021057 [Perkinsus marinus ATCC 50983]